MLRLTAGTSVQYLDKGARLCVRVGEETLMLRDVGDGMLAAWQDSLQQQADAMQAEASARLDGAGAAGAEQPVSGRAPAGQDGGGGGEATPMAIS